MSALGGIYNYGGNNIDPEALAYLGDSLAHLGPDGGYEVRSGRVGFAFRAFHTNRESRLEQQPLVTREGLMLAWDGRLDNRPELISLLRGRLVCPPDSVTDGALVIAAYNEWGQSFARRLIGDFAFSIWDPSSRQLLLARDPVGTRPLYYYSNQEYVFWASDLNALIAASRVALEVDEDYIAGFLSFGKDVGRTPFRGISAVRPGHVISIDHVGAARSGRFWGLDPNAEVRFKTDGEYEERFRELFEEAVRCRLRSDLTVMAELSGGLDSSSIVCMADHVMARGEVQARRLETVSHVSEECASADERRFISPVEEHRGRPTNYVWAEEYLFLTPLPDPSRVATLNPFLTNAGYVIALNKLMPEKGARVLLSGVGGDELLHSVNDPTPELSDLLVTGKFFQLFKRLRVWGGLLREPYARLLWRNALLPNSPLWLQSRVVDKSKQHVSSWMNTDFVSRTRLRNRMSAPVDVFGFRLPSGRDQSTGFLSVADALSLGHYPEVCRYDMTYPFLHRPLVEFLCAIPFEQLLRPGESRSLMRRSLRGVLPEKTRQRKGKGRPREIVARYFPRQWPLYAPLFEDPLVARYGFMDPKILKEAFARARHGVDAETHSLVSAMTLEVWLRAMEARRAPEARSTPTARRIAQQTVTT